MRRAGNKPLWAHKTNWSREINRYLLRRKFEWSRFDIAECYMIMGGIPTYLSLLNPLRSLSDNVDNLFFRKRSELWDEFRQLYRTHYSNSDQYIRIVEALSTRRSGMTRRELIAVTHLPDNGALSRKLQDLNDSDFIRVSAQFEKKNERYYQLRDYYTLFYFRFIHHHPGRDEHFWTHFTGTPSKYAWAGLSFEFLCLDHIRQIKQKIGISAVLTEESSWFWRENDAQPGTQIDLLIDRREHVINLCEIRHTENEFVIDKDTDLSLRTKREVFRSRTGTKKPSRLFSSPLTESNPILAAV